MRSDFGVLILTHGRPDRVVTHATLRRQGYTGPITIVIDNEDKRGEEYRRAFAQVAGTQVVCFDKAAVAQRVDVGDNLPGRGVVLFARHAAFDVARSLGLTFSLVLDDDYTKIQWRFTHENRWATTEHTDGSSCYYHAKDLDSVFEAFVRFLEHAPKVQTIAMAQGGDFIGGHAGTYGRTLALRRKAMNSFFCHVDRPLRFAGRINEDTTGYVTGAVLGELWLTYNAIALTQEQTQQNAGGLTETYLQLGTYTKSFYSVMAHPSGVSVRALRGQSHTRLHHSVDWNRTAPKILGETARKAR